MSKLLAVGTVAFDAIETPFGKTDKILGGSGTFVGLAASQFGVETGNATDSVQLLKTNGGDVGANKVQFNKAGTYQITLTYSVGVNQGANTPYLIFRTLKDGTSQIGPTVVVNEAFPTINTPIPLIIPITIQITTPCYYNFQMMRSNAGANDGGLVKNGTPLNVSGVTEPSIATIKISKLI